MVVRLGRVVHVICVSRVTTMHSMPWWSSAAVDMHDDGGDDGDGGRYHNGLFHLFATASADGGDDPDKIHEQIGWAVSKDGIHFTQHPSNPIAPYKQVSFFQPFQ